MMMKNADFVEMYDALPMMSFRGSAATVGISRYDAYFCAADRRMVPGDCHVGPLGLLAMT